MSDRLPSFCGTGHSVSRRQALELATAGAFALGFPTAAFSSQPQVLLPESPMAFRRRLERPLRDGNRLVVEREWRLRFNRRGRGFAIEGEQTAVSVEAPAKLERLAELERARSTQEMWPVLLSSHGLILAAGNATSQEDLDRAIAIAKDLISQQEAADQVKKSRMSDLAIFERAGSQLSANMPRDLFFPDAQPVHLIRGMDLPNGRTGEYEVIYTSRRSAEGNWLDRAQREVITRIDESERRSREEWTLRPA